MTKKQRSWLVAVLALSAPLTACGSSHHSAAGSTSSSTSTTAPGVTSTSTSSSPSVDASSTTAIPVSPTAPVTGSTASGPQRCTSGALSGSLANQNGTAGSVYYTLLVTNHGAIACILQGWPGVSFVAGSGGRQVGASAARIPGPAPTITVAPGSSAGAVLQVTEATNYGTGCGLTSVAGLRLYPPDQLAAIYVPHADRACANKSDVTLHVGAFQSSS